MINSIEQSKIGKPGRRWPAMMAAVMLIGLSLLGRADAAAGDLDGTFGTGGKVMTDFFALSDGATAIAVQSDGKIVVAGVVDDAGYNIGRLFGLVRYNPDGTLDPTFGTGGQTSFDFASSSSIVSLAIQMDGKIVVVGTVESPTDSDFGILRFDSDGTLDATFGTGGQVTTDFSGQFDGARAVAVQSDGKIVAGGTSLDAGGQLDFALARYLDNGDLDPSFGSAGKTTTDFSGQADLIRDLAIQSDGKIVAAGMAQFGNFGVARYEVNGSLDAGFGNGGLVNSDFSSSIDEGMAVALQSDGKIVVGGRANGTGESADFGLIRYEANGSLDAAFGTGGKVTTDFLGFGDTVNDIAVQSNGKIVAVGLATIFLNQSTGDIDFGLARYNTDGTLDAGFGNGGKLTTVFTNSEAAEAVAIQADCKILVAGFTNDVNTSDSQFAVARYDSDGCAEEPPPVCPNPQGFWKNNPALWPVDSLMLGSQTYSKAELLKLLNDSTKSDASVILARQLIAAKLNIFNGSDPAPAANSIANADSALSGFGGKLAYKVKSSSAIGKMMVADSSLLDSYNNGVLTPVCTQ